MRISRKELAAMSPRERKEVLDKMAHPAAAALPKKPVSNASPFAFVVHALSSLGLMGRASR